MLRGLRAVAKKEFRHLRRDRKGLAYILLVPFIMIFIYGYGISIDMRDVRTAVIDQSGGPYSAHLIQSLKASGVFRLEDYGPRSGRISPLETAELDLKAGQIREILIIPREFDGDLREGRPAEIETIFDGSEATSALLIGRLLERIVDEVREAAGPSRFPAAVRIRLAFNPDGRSAVPIVPGLLVIILMVISALMTSIAIAREKETGAADILILSPLSSRDIIVGKALPYVLVALFDGAVILVLAGAWFHIPFRGSLAALAFFSGLYVISGAALGILISTTVATQREAMIAEVLTTLLPAFFLSGFIIPLESLPGVLRGLSYFVPATYFLRIVRGVILKGAEFRYFLLEGAALAGFGFGWLGLAVWGFSRRRRSPR